MWIELLANLDLALGISFTGIMLVREVMGFNGPRWDSED